MLYLADTSAWHRAMRPETHSVWNDRLLSDVLATCAPVMLEVLFSARSAGDYERVREELHALHQLPCGEPQWVRALDVQRQLARRGGLHHRSVKLPDLLVAATAEAAGAVVWHYDEDYDRIAAVTGQPAQ